MRLSDFYNLALALGREKDPRPKTILKRESASLYPDTQILYGKPDTQVRRILVGIDIEAQEILLADRLRQQGGLDLVISHHPEGRAWAIFYEVMKLQIDMLTNLGVPLKEAAELLEERKQEVERKVLPQNHNRAVDVAELLDIPFMCMHTVADNHAQWFMDKLLREKKPKQLGDILDILKEVPEYKIAASENNPPRIIAGAKHAAVGKIYVEMTGGTEGPKKVYAKLYKLGIRTLVCMHLSEEHFKEVKDNALNVVIAGHTASDNLGLNLLLDNIEKRAKEELQVINCSGFRRVKR
ncbi:MAG: NGG1p interacting factor NIF3 [Candidatus Omnitrophica bacterium]|nr:NGG1p interacting factor NIF3 [Candidatus Omnitrophota bacterium]MCM8770936.1 NGG1p interacting factor NIF3 [Candidatus Omnitrophota bacterium]